RPGDDRAAAEPRARASARRAGAAARARSHADRAGRRDRRDRGRPPAGTPMTRALVTNDDGIRSPGLCELARIAAGLGWDVVVAAPAAEASGSSAAITGTGTVAVTGQDEYGRADRSTIRVERRELETLPGVPAYAVHAAPALIALLAAHGAFGEIPDVVLSGIN